MAIEKTVFICYRRTNQYQALAVYQHLTALGYDVFYDIDSIRSGDWQQIILENIKARAHFLIVLTPSAVDRFNERGDVMRLEIETAIESQRNIIPLLFDNFDFDTARKHLVGKKLKLLPKYNGLPIPSARFLKSAMDDLERYLSQDVDTIVYPLSPSAKKYAQQKQAEARNEALVTEEQLTATDYFGFGYQAVENEDYSAAIKDFTQAILLDPSYAYAYVSRADAYGGIGDFDRAIGDLDQALVLNPSLFEAYNSRGIMYGIKRNYDRAIADFDQAIHLMPEFATPYFNRGNVYVGKGDYDKAIADFDQAIRLNLEVITALVYLNRAEVYEKKGEYDRAIADYCQAIRLKPPHPFPAEIYAKRGQSYIMEGEYDRAIADLNRVIALESHNIDAYIKRGIAYAQKGDYKRAISDLNQAILLDPKDAAIYFKRGMIYTTKDEHEKALADFYVATQIDPDYERAKEMLEETLQQMKKG